MQIQFLGTGAGMPSKLRNTSALALKLLEERNTVWLFDCGEATQHQILHTTIRPRKIEKIFITHLHGDHIFGLPGLLGSRSFLGGDEPLTIYGPKGLEQWIRQTIQITQTHLNYPLRFVEIDEEGVVFEDDQFIVTTKKLQHVIPCYGYRIEQKPLPGTLLIEKAMALGVPNGPLLGQLKKGQDVTLENGLVVRSEEVTSDNKEGFIVTVLGDTRFCENAIQLSKSANIVIHEATFDHATTSLAAQYGHATNIEAAKVAQQAGANMLLLNHISARFLHPQIIRMQQEAQQIHTNTQIVKDFDLFVWNQHTLIKE